MKRFVVVVLTIGIITVGIACMLWVKSWPVVVGVWKGTDSFGNEHYYSFKDDGTFTWWDQDRDHRGANAMREPNPFKGFYRQVGRKTLVAEMGGFPSQLVGRFTWISRDELKQEDGFISRSGVVYRRLAAK